MKCDIHNIDYSEDDYDKCPLCSIQQLSGDAKNTISYRNPPPSYAGSAGFGYSIKYYVDNISLVAKSAGEARASNEVSL
jgi:hypothetical protein